MVISFSLYELAIDHHVGDVIRLMLVVLFDIATNIATKYDWGRGHYVFGQDDELGMWESCTRKIGNGRQWRRTL